MYRVMCLVFLLAGLTATAFAQDLFTAAKNGDLDQVKSLVETANVSVDVMDSNHDTPLVSALEGIRETTDAKAIANDIAVCSYLIDKGAHLDVVDAGGFTPLAYAIQNGSLDAVRLLLDKRANYTDVLHLSGLGNGSPLDYALANLGNMANYNLAGSIQVVKVLCDYDLAHGHKLNYDAYKDNYVVAVVCDNLDGLKAIVKSGSGIEGAAYLAFWFEKTDLLDWLHAIGQFDPNKDAACNFANIDRNQSYFDWAVAMTDGTMKAYLTKYERTPASN